MAATMQRKFHGEALKSNRAERCCICGKKIPVWSLEDGTEINLGLNNPSPLNDTEGAFCCDECDVLVTAARMTPKHGVVRAMEAALAFRQALRNPDLGSGAYGAKHKAQ